MIIKNKKLRAFTLVELMIVIVIISVLLMITFPNFKASQDRAKEATVKSNMYMFHQCAEMYSVDWGGIYALNSQMLKDEAMLNKYWKPFQNPFTSKVDIATTTFVSIAEGSGFIDPIDFPAGNVSYKNVQNVYGIYAAGKENGKAILDKGRIFHLTNQ